MIIGCIGKTFGEICSDLAKTSHAAAYFAIRPGHQLIADLLAKCFRDDPEIAPLLLTDESSPERSER